MEAHPVGQRKRETIYPIDPVIQRIAREFAQFLREHPDTINLIPG
jgi:hypothetical protein